MSPKRDEYTAKMKLQLDELNTRIDAIEAKAHEIKEDARKMYHAEVVKLRQQSKLAMDKLGELKTSGEDSWVKMVAEMDKIRDAFIHSFKYFKSQI